MKNLTKLIFSMLLVAFCNQNVFSQSDVSGVTGHVRVGGYYAGWDNTGAFGTLDIKNDFNSSIDLYTFTNLHGSMDANGNFTIGLFNANNYFGITNQPVLWHKGNITNILVGVGAGLTNPLGNDNTFVGYNAGLNATNLSLSSVLVGSSAGQQNRANGSTFIGYWAGLNNLNGDFNTCVGCSTGVSLLNGGVNAFLGKESGYNTTDGSWNTFLGAQAGISNVLGDINLCLGSSANVSQPNLINASAIGANALVTNADQMILGGNFTYFGVPHSTFIGIGLSGNANGPLNFLEINSGSDVTRSPSNSTGLKTATGLRFNQVKNNPNPNLFTATAQTYDQTTILPWGKVLTVDENGDMGLTDAAGIGNQCGATPNPLRADWEIPLIDFSGGVQTPHDFYFSGQWACKSNVAIGLNCNANNPISKLHVLQASTCIQAGPPAVPGQSIAGEFDNQAGGGGFAMGLMGSVTRNVAAFNIGVKGYTPVAGAALTTSFAVYGDLGPVAIPCPPTFPPAPPCAPTPPDAAGFFNGDLVTTMSYYSASDANLKTNIIALVNPMSIINQLNPKAYSFNEPLNLSMHLASGTQVGLLAQDVYNVAPQLTKNCVFPARFDSLGNQTHAAISFLAINYPGFVPYLIGGMKQQDSTIQALQNQVNALSALVENCCGSGQLHENPDGGNNNTGNSMEVILSSKSAILFQNMPNPFGDGTVIRYFVPENSEGAIIIFYDEFGKEIKNVELPTKGENAQLNVSAVNLASGIYSYTLIINGTTIDSKRMLKTK